MSDVGLVLVGLAIVVGIVGVVVPVLPGGLLVWAAVAVWAVSVNDALGWSILAVATVAVGSTQVLKYTVPVRRLRDSDVPRESIVVGVIAAIVGFFVIPVVGLFGGFPLGIYLWEWRRLQSGRLAWASTRAAIRNIGLSILIELAGTLVAAGAWLAAVLALD